MTRRALVVSLHDVSPRTQRGVRGDPDRSWPRSACRAARCSSSRTIIGAGTFSPTPRSATWLRAQAAAGHELVMHGYHHQRARRAGESVGAKLTTRIYTADEGEFYDLDRATATALVEKARARIPAARRRAGGVHRARVAAQRGGRGRAARAGLSNTPRASAASSICNGGRIFQSQSLVWSVRSGVAAAGRACAGMRCSSAGSPRIPCSAFPSIPSISGTRRSGNKFVNSSPAPLPTAKPLTYHAWLRGCRSRVLSNRHRPLRPCLATRGSLNLNSQPSESRPPPPLPPQRRARRNGSSAASVCPTATPSRARSTTSSASAGMDFVTLTDHNRIDGCLEIADRPGVFLSEQVSTRFPDDRCEVHVLVWGINEAQHREIAGACGRTSSTCKSISRRKTSRTPWRIRSTASTTASALAHLEKLILLFRHFEGLNGHRDALLSDVARVRPRRAHAGEDRRAGEPARLRADARGAVAQGASSAARTITAACFPARPSPRRRRRRTSRSFSTAVRAGRCELRGAGGTPLAALAQPLQQPAAFHRRRSSPARRARACSARRSRASWRARIRRSFRGRTSSASSPRASPAGRSSSWRSRRTRRSGSSSPHLHRRRDEGAARARNRRASPSRSGARSSSRTSSPTSSRSAFSPPS